MSQKLYILDGHSQIYRAYYAPFRDLTSPTGEPTRATYVFSNMLLRFIAEKKPDFLAMAVDGPSSELARVAFYPQYKAHRPPMPPDLVAQIDVSHQVVEAFGLPVLSLSGVEAAVLT